MPTVSQSDRGIIEQVVREMAITDQIDIVDLAGFYLAVSVNSYADYVKECTGSQKKLVTVGVDESDENELGNKYYYEGNNVVNPDPQF